MAQDLICIMCPNGCRLHVDDQLNVTGNKCLRGVTYGKAEVTHPVRVVTSTVKIASKQMRVCPVKTKDPVAKEKIFDVMKEINKISILPPVHIGDVIQANIADTGVDLIATRDVID